MVSSIVKVTRRFGGLLVISSAGAHAGSPGSSFERRTLGTGLHAGCSAMRISSSARR
jgi:hypothetical protein